MTLHASELPDDVLEKAGLKKKEGKPPKMVKAQHVALGFVLVALKGLTSREALWVLRTANVLVRGYRKDKEAPLGKERNAKSNKAWKKGKEIC